MAIFNSYVGLPEGPHIYGNPAWLPTPSTPNAASELMLRPTTKLHGRVRANDLVASVVDAVT